MPASLSLPDLPVGHIVQGDLVLRNVVVETAPSTRVVTTPSTQPALPLDGSGQTRTPSLIVPKRDAPPPQYAPDLIIPNNLPADAYSVLIDTQNNAVVKANPAETAMLLQRGFYFIGSFDSVTADAVIKDMLENPIQTQGDAIDAYLDVAIPYALGSYLSGLVLFNALQNSTENWGSFLGYNEQVDQALTTPKIPTNIAVPSQYPKTAVIRVALIGGTLSDKVLYEGVMMPKGLVLANNLFRSLYRQWANQPANWSWKMLPDEMSFQLVTHPSRTTPENAEWIIINKEQQAGLTKYIDFLNPIAVDAVLAVEFVSKTPFVNPVINTPTNFAQVVSNVQANLSLPSNVTPQVKQLTAEYVALNESIAEMEMNGDHVTIENIQPMSADDLHQAYANGDASVQMILNPNAGKDVTKATDLQLFVRKDFPDGTTTWTIDPTIKRSDCVEVRQEMVGGKQALVCTLPSGGTAYGLTNPSVPSVVANDGVVKGVVKENPAYASAVERSRQIGSALGVPQGCVPTNPTALPPKANPNNCSIINTNEIIKTKIVNPPPSPFSVDSSEYPPKPTPPPPLPANFLKLHPYQQVSVASAHNRALNEYNNAMKQWQNQVNQINQQKVNQAILSKTSGVAGKR